MGVRIRSWRTTCRSQIVLNAKLTDKRRYLHASSIQHRQDDGGPSTSSTNTHQERNIFSDESIAEEDGVQSKGESLLNRQREALQNEPVWNGDADRVIVYEALDGSTDVLNQ